MKTFIIKIITEEKQRVITKVEALSKLQAYDSMVKITHKKDLKIKYMEVIK